MHKGFRANRVLKGERVPQESLVNLVRKELKDLRVNLEGLDPRVHKELGDLQGKEVLPE